MPGATGGQDEDGRGEASVAPTAKQRESVDLGETEVQNDGVKGFGMHEEVGALAVGGAVSGIAGGGQRLC